MILITGGLGHIGSATVQALLDLGRGVRTRSAPQPRDPEGRFSAPVTAVQADVKDLDALRAIGRDYAITGIVHMAGSMPWPPNPDEAPVMAARDALGGLFNIIEVAQEWGVERLSLASTIGVYAGLSNTGALSEDLPVPLTAPHVIPTFKRISELLGNHLAAGHRPGDHPPAYQRGMGTARAPPELRLPRAAVRPRRRDGHAASTSPASAGGSRPTTVSTSATSTTSAGRPRCCRPPNADAHDLQRRLRQDDHQRRGDRRDQVGRARIRRSSSSPVPACRPATSTSPGCTRTPG